MNCRGRNDHAWQRFRVGVVPAANPIVFTAAVTPAAKATGYSRQR